MRRKAASARIDMRTTPQLKYFLELAAFIGGYDSLSTFITEASETLAKQIFDDVDESRTLSPNDCNLLLNFLKDPPEPNAALKEAYAKVMAMYKLDDSGQSIYAVDSSLIKQP